MSEPIKEDISVNRELNAIVIGETALKLYSEKSGELPIRDVGETFVEFGSDDENVSVDFRRVSLESGSS